jgi:hypothetical protein
VFDGLAVAPKHTKKRIAHLDHADNIRLLDLAADSHTSQILATGLLKLRVETSAFYARGAGSEKVLSREHYCAVRDVPRTWGEHVNGWRIERPIGSKRLRCGCHLALVETCMI